MSEFDRSRYHQVIPIKVIYDSEWFIKHNVFSSCFPPFVLGNSHNHATSIPKKRKLWLLFKLIFFWQLQFQQKLSKPSLIKQPIWKCKKNWMIGFFRNFSWTIIKQQFHIYFRSLPPKGRRTVLDCMVWQLALLRLWRPTGRRHQQNSRGGGWMGFQMCCSSVLGLSVIFFWEEHGKITSWINTSFI